MTVSHCSIVAYTYRATFSSRASPHDLVHSPWLRLRAKRSVHVSTVRDSVLRGVAIPILDRVVYRLLLHK